MNNLDEQQNLLNVIGFLLLSDAFKNCKKNIHNKYDLDTVSFVTISSL